MSSRLIAVTALSLTLSTFVGFAACDGDGGTHALVDHDTAGGDTFASDTAGGDTFASDTADAGDTRTPNPALTGTVPATFTVTPGVETVTVTDAEAGEAITLYGPTGARLVTVVADEFGQAHFAYVPSEYAVLDLRAGGSPHDLVKDGRTITPGDDYVLRDDDRDPPAASAAFHVLDVDDVLPPSGYEGQALHGVHYGITGLGDGEEAADGFNYITVRDGVKLSAMVRLPDPNLWGDGPYPTVVEYSGYSPSQPDNPEAGSRIATLLGYASVGVNMRGTGCSGGVFDVFNPAQHADGYDVIEVVARQPWVLHHKVGMVGLSYGGISQLYVARTNPPSLAAVTPLSVIGDSWQQLWPGGIYNDGFTRQWLEQRDAEAAPNGQSWTERRIAAGDAVCEAHQQLRNQNFAFEELFRELEYYPEEARARSLPTLVREITAPVYLTGAFQDEQTGGQFAEMLDAFVATPTHKFTLYNGRHVDGYSPLVLTRWFEFLELYVAERVPRLSDLIRTVAGPELGKNYDSEGLGFEPDRFASFADDDYAGVLAAYEAEAPVRVLFESGAGGEQPGAPVARFEASWSAWPPPDAEERVFYLGPEGTLRDDPPVAADSGVDAYEHDPDAGQLGFFGPRGYQLMKRLWDIRWTQFPEGKSLSYLTAPLTEDMVLAGPVYADLWMTSEVEDVDVQVSIMEVRPDGTEFLLQNGWHRLGHRALDGARTNALRVEYTFDESGYEPLVPGQFMETKVPLPSVGHPLRAGSRLRVVIATPGRNHGTWEFDNPDYGGTTPVHEVARTPAMPSHLHLTIVKGLAVPPGVAPCPSLRGQPCRDYVPTTNTTLPE